MESTPGVFQQAAVIVGGLELGCRKPGGACAGRCGRPRLTRVLHVGRRAARGSASTEPRTRADRAGSLALALTGMADGIPERARSARSIRPTCVCALGR
jgi:hypothetical protein